MEICAFCQRVVIDEQGQHTEGYGSVIRGKHICGRCTEAFRFSLGG